MQASKLLAVAVPGVIAWALSLPVAAAEPAQTSAGSIEEIIVTSRREQESIQDVPVAVSAFTAQDIERIAPRTIVDMDGLMPNVSIQQQTAGPGMGAIYIRGIGSADVEKTTPPQVGMILDGIFQGTNTGQIIDMFDIDQVEVNRGPQGVLYGKNTTGGTIVVRRTQPVLNEFHAKASVEGGTYNAENYKGRVNIPLIDDKLALKVGGMVAQRDGFYRNSTRGTDDGNVDYKTYTVALKYQPVDELTAVLTYDNIDDTGSNGVPQDALINGDSPFKTEANLKMPVKYNVDSVGLNLQWDLGDGTTLESITGYVDSKDVVQQDFDNGTDANVAVPLVQLHTLRDQKYSQTSQELRLTGDLVENVGYTLGGFWFNSSLDFGQGTNQRLQLPYAAFGLPPGFTCATFGLTANPTVGDALCQTGNIASWQATNEQSLSKAVFGSLRYQLTDRLELSAGARYIDEDISFKGAFYTASVPAGSIQPPRGANSPTAQPPFPINADNDWNKTIYEATATFQMTETNMVYARFSQGFRSGGFSNRGNDPRFLSFKPENSDAYEIGSKNEFFDNKLQLNLTAFDTIVQQAQFGSVLTTTGIPPGTNTIVNNAGGDIEVYGFEVQTMWLINDLFSINATYGYLDNKVDSFSISSERVPYNPPNADGSACNPLTQGPCPLVDIKGGDLSRAPKYNYSVSGVYAQSFGEYNVSANVTWKGQDDTIIVPGVTAASTIEQDAYSVVDARIAVETNLKNGSLVRLSAVGKNLNDEEYLWSALPLGTGGFQGWANPRTFAVELLYQM